MIDHELVDSTESLAKALEKVRKAQEEYSKFTQEMVDEIFKAASLAANNMRVPLAKMAYEETGMGVIEDKVIKLIRKSNARGGLDNISVAYLEKESGDNSDN